jgi:type IX secretion system PorP/SprF family membrane protein
MHLARLFIFVSLFCSVSTFGQQESYYYNFWNVQQYYLPALTGIENKHEAVILARDQWIGLNGRPRTINVQYSHRLNKIKSGIGFVYQLEKIGFAQAQKAKLSYAYHLKLGEKQLLSFGTNIGLNFYRFKTDWIPPTSEPDPSLPSEKLQTNFSADFGMNYKISNWQIGLGMTQLTDQRKKSSFTFTYERHYYLQSSYKFRLGKKMEFTPRLLLQTDFVKIAATLNMQLKINPFLQVGLATRNSKFLGANVGFYFSKKFYLGYSAEITFGPLMDLNKYYTHEAVLSFTIPN